MRTRKLTLSAVLLVLSFACQESGTTGPDTEPQVRADASEDSGPVTPTRGFEGYTKRGELRTGFIRLPGGTPHEVTYEVHDGRALWQGDIVLGPADAIPASLAELEGIGSDAAQGFRIFNILRHWTGGVVPYVIHSNVPNPDRIRNAIEIVERSTAGVDFVPRSGQDNYVRFVADNIAVGDGAVCLSSIGMIGGLQDITLNDGCDGFSTAHEILHALGVRHEQNRCDRDQHVQINEFNIVPGYHSQFEKLCDEGFAVGAYDEESLMHYGPFAFALIPDVPTIVSLHGRDHLMGQRNGLSRGDSETVNDMYGAFNAPPLANFSPFAGEDPLEFPEGTPVQFESKSADPDDDKLWYHWQLEGDPACSDDPFGCTNETVTRIFPDDGEYEITLTVYDSPIEISDVPGFHSDDKTVMVTVLNVPPAVQAGPDITVNEGATFEKSVSFTDPGDDAPWKPAVDFGDGMGEQSLPSLLGREFMFEHMYVDNRPGNAPFEVDVRVTDKDGESGSDQLDITVLNVVPNVLAGADGSLESGAFLSFTGNFGDPGELDAPWSWEIDWGDGETSGGTTRDQSAAISASHQFCGSGLFVIRLDVTDKDEGTGTDTRLLEVVARVVDLLVKPGNDPSPLNPRGGGVLPVAVLSTADLDATDVDPATVLLGDGVAPETSVARRNNGQYQVAEEDVNGDGLIDLVLSFDVRTLIANEDLTGTTATLRFSAALNDACTSLHGEGVVVIRP